MKKVITQAEIEALEDGGELRMPRGALLTPAARDLAAARQIRLVEVEAEPPAPPERTVALGSDHAGFRMKEALKPVFAELGLEVRDVGVDDEQPADYPEIARQVAELVAAGAAARGVILDGAGIGSAIAANKVPGVRAALCYDQASAKNSREHNNANVLTLGGRLLTETQAREVLYTWLTSSFAGGRHARRVDQIAELERVNQRINESTNQQILNAMMNFPPVDPIALHGPVFAAQAPALAAGLAPGAEGLNIPELVCPGCVQRCPQTCARKTEAILAAGADRVSASERLTSIQQELAARIDHTLLRPEATRDQVVKLCGEARRFGFATVCVNPAWVPLCAQLLCGSAVKVCTVVGFPLGATLTEVKRAETELAVKLGAQEIDMVIQIGALRSGDLDTVSLDIRAVVEAARRGGAAVKVILETALLQDEEKIVACALSKLAGADFVKTSTGFGPSGATTHDVALMRRVVGGEMGIKAAGGIRSLEDLQKLSAAGATRIGASASVKILEEAAGTARS